MSYIFENKLKIIGSDDEVQAVKNYFKGDLIGIVPQTYENNNKIIPQPEELYENIDPLGMLVLKLFFTTTYKYIIEHTNEYIFYGEDLEFDEDTDLNKCDTNISNEKGINEDSTKGVNWDPSGMIQFIKLSTSDKIKGIELALNYIKLIENYDCITKSLWRIENWEISWRSFQDEVDAANVITLITRMGSIKYGRNWCSINKLVENLSKIFPLVIFDSEHVNWDIDGSPFIDDASCIIQNGKVLYYYGFNQLDEKIIEIDYSEINYKIFQMRKSQNLA